MILIPHWRQRRTHVIVELDIVVIVVVLQKAIPKGPSVHELFNIVLRPRQWMLGSSKSVRRNNLRLNNL